MAGKAEQIIPRGGRTWALVFMGLDPESRSANTSTRRSMGSCRDAQAYLSRIQRDRGLGVYFEPSCMSLDGYLDKGQAQVQRQLGIQMHHVGNKGCCIGESPSVGASAYSTRHWRSKSRAYSLVGLRSQTSLEF